MSTEDPEEVQRQQAAWRDHAQEELSEGRSRDEVVASLVELGQPEAEARRLVSILVPRSIWIARIPPDAEPSELAAAPAMGSRREVAAHIHAAIPGMRFDQNGRGVLKCPEYSLEFELGAEKEVTLISLEVRGGVEALDPIRALSRRTGWRVLDREGTFSLPGGEPEVPMEPVPAPASAPRPATGSHPRPTTGSHPRPASGPQPRPTSGGHPARPGSGGQRRVVEAASPWPITINHWTVLAAVVVLAGLVYMGLGAATGSQIRTNEQAAIAELTAFAQAERQFAAANSGGFVPPAALVAGGAAASIPVGEADSRYLQPLRSGYRFRFQGDRDADVAAPVSPAWRGFVYQAVPEHRGETGLRNFAYYSSTGAIHAREDGFMPGPQDPRVVTVP
jgi:hypothetical protein